MNNPFAVIATMFLYREHDARKRGDHNAAVAYANAYDLLCYAVENRDDCLSQFDSYDKANEFLNNTNCGELWELEEIFDKENQK